MQLFNLIRLTTLACLVTWTALPVATAFGQPDNRRTPLVQAVASCRDSVVNLRGKKSVAHDSIDLGNDEARMVNGMGTGVVIDSRGYVLTNYHVVQDVRNIQVTTRDHQECWAALVAHDPVTDLAIIKIDLKTSLPEIRLGRSADLLLAESVAAVGNAYGYEHTVTTGIVSHLDRTVQVNDHQIYQNLIQTDAPINPGNSGGPLLNLNGEMIGVNVAVRIGAQGIAFAIPVDRAIEVAANLLEQHNRKSVLHGISVETRYEAAVPRVVVAAVQTGSPAASAGIVAGDWIESVNGSPVVRAVDFQRALIGRSAQSTLQLGIRRGDAGAVQQTSLVLQPAILETSLRTAVVDPAGWNSMGLRLVEATAAQMANRHSDYQRGLWVLEVRPNSPAEAEGIIPGDILVAMFGLKTETMDNLDYILKLPEIRRRDEFRFYILRENECFLGEMRIADFPAVSRQVSGSSSNK